VRKAIGRSRDDEALRRELSRYACWTGLRPADLQVQGGDFRSFGIAIVLFAQLSASALNRQM
jgi:hypothetical protein